MSEAPAEQPTAPAEAAPQEAPAQEVDWKAEARKWEDRAKKNSDAAQRLAEIEEASKTAEQKAAERLAELEQKVTEYETREQVAKWKAEVAEATGVPVDALRGNTLEDIQAHGEQLKALIPTEEPKKGAIGPYVPAEGTAPRGELGSNAEKFAAAVEAHLT